MIPRRRHTRGERVRVVAYCDARRRMGGAEASLATLIGALGAGVDVTVMGVDRTVTERLAAGRPGAATVVVPPFAGALDARAWAAHLRVLRRLRPDIFQANLPGPWYARYALIAALTTPGVRTVAFVHLAVAPSRAQQRWAARAVLRSVSATVTVGERSARRLEQLALLRRGRVRTIHNGVADARLDPMPRAEGPTLGSLGRLERQKGYDVLLHALRRLPGARLVLVGDGSQREPLESLARELGVADRVTITGWLESPRAQLAAFDVFVLPSRFEAFPLAIVEAMLASLPVVATDVGSVAEAVLDGRTGALVPAEDPEALAAAVRRLLDDPGARRAMGEAGRAIALERFTPAAMAAGFERLYDEVRR
jgi:glycosyltransferase involved in cell wall biosynthesis